MGGSVRGARWTLAAGSLALLAAGGGHRPPSQTSSVPVVIPLDGTRGLTLIGTHARAVTYLGRRAVELTEAPVSMDTVTGLEEVAPGKYESYADLVPGRWTHVRVVVRGERATLYVNDAPQPVLVVNDLKLLAGRGKIGLWIGSGTIGYFSRMVVTAANAG